MDKKIALFIEENHLFNKDLPIVLALSGGVDSMVLLTILNALNYKVIAAHVNHNVRKESTDEYEFIKEYTASFGICLEYMKLPKIEKENFHQESRNFRYSFFNDIVKKYNAQCIVTAHHCDDNIETIIMKIIRGSNLYGYGGISLVSNFDNSKLVRPFLFITKDEIINYAFSKNIPYKEDKSNLQDKYTRNRFRKNVLPFLKTENPKLEDKISQYSNIVHNAFFYIRKIAKQHILLWENKIDNLAFIKLDIAIKHEIIALLLESKDIQTSYKKIMQICLFIENDKPNSFFCLNKVHVLQKKYNQTLLEEICATSPFHIVAEKEGTYCLPNHNSIIITRKMPKNNKKYLKLCYNNIAWPITIRNRRDGDFINFKYGTKKIKNLFIDLKIPKNVRESLPIILDRNNKVLGIPGITNSSETLKEILYIVYTGGE